MSEPSSNEELQLSIVTVDFTPAVVTFNAEQISAVLDQQLAKYKGLTFTEADEASAKKTIAELRKGKTMLETYRKDTKSKLTASVTDFENEIKKLAAKFDEVIIPLTEQTAQFETDRREKKSAEIDGIVAGLIVEYELNPQFAGQLIYPADYLNRSTSIKSISLELRAKADQLRADQQRLDSELTLIRGNVNVANQSLSGAGLLETTYTRLLGPLTLQQVLTRIAEDVEAIRDREAKAAAAAEARRIAAEAVIMPDPPVAEIPASPVVVLTPPTDPQPEFEGSPVEVSGNQGRFVETYTVTGTEAQLERLEAFLEQYGYEWHVR